MDRDLQRIGTIGISEEHLALHEAARGWVARHVDPKATLAMLDDADPGLPPFWEALRETGWFGLHLPESLGGEGYGLLELAIVLEELGWAGVPGPFVPTVAVSALLAQLGHTDPATELGALAARLATGALLAGVAVGPNDLVARPSGPDGRDGWTLEGGAPVVLGGSGVDVVLVVATDTDGRALPLLVDVGAAKRATDETDATETPTLVARPSTDGTRPVASLRCPESSPASVPAARRLAGEGTIDVLEPLTVLLGAEAVGLMGWCTATASAYAAVREQFGRPIGQFQAVKHRCAGMAVRLEQSRALVWDAVRGGGPDDERSLAAAMVAAVVPDDAFAVAKDCIQVLGGVGYTWEHPAHIYAKRALAVRQLVRGPGAAVADRTHRGVLRSLRVELPPEAEPVRAEVRAFLAELQEVPKPEWNGRLADHGFLVPNWPAPWGRGASPIEQLVIDEELAAARIRRPHLQVAAWVLPTIINHGTEAQQRRWVPPSLRQEVLWCQLFSEPGAGSDLASLQMRAVRDEAAGGWHLTGQKVWTTMAHLAQWGLCLARTGEPGTEKHEGITAFVIDMASPGVECRPLRELTGAELFNEVFFDSVFVPDDCVVGAVGRGWEAARTTLANERVSMGSGSSFGPQLASVMALPPPADDPGFADRLGLLVAEGHAVAAMGLRTTLRALAGVAPGSESSVRKLLGVEHEQKVQELALDALGPSAAATDGIAAAWVAGFLGNRALSIAGGTSDIQRNIVAERLLGLPKDP